MAASLIGTLADCCLDGCVSSFIFSNFFKWDWMKAFFLLLFSHATRRIALNLSFLETFWYRCSRARSFVEIKDAEFWPCHRLCRRLHSEAGEFSLKCKISLIVGIFCTHSSLIHVSILLKKLGLNVGFSHWQYERVKVDSTSCSLLTDWAATYIHLLSLLGDTLAFSLWVWKCDSSKNLFTVFILQLISLRLISDVRCDVMWRR